MRWSMLWLASPLDYSRVFAAIRWNALLGADFRENDSYEV
jgi:hypothetical protein